MRMIRAFRSASSPRCFSSTKGGAASFSSATDLFDAGKLKAGDILVQNEADSELGQAVIKLAKERGIKTLNVVADKPGTALVVEKLKHIGGDIVVTESYTNSWYMKRLLSNVSKPTVGINYSNGSAAVAVAKILPKGATLMTCGTQLPEKVAYPGAGRRPVLWSHYLKSKNLNHQSV